MSSGCGDVISLEDMKTIKLHQTFEAEVITGRVGGVSTGPEIDTATNAVTGQVQKTMPAILRDIGFSPASFDFTSGGTLTVADRDAVVYNPTDNNWYSWAGTLPKAVAAGEDPTADSNWKPRTDQLLRQDLSSSDGAKLSGYRYSDVYSTLSRIKTLYDYGEVTAYGHNLTTDAQIRQDAEDDNDLLIPGNVSIAKENRGVGRDGTALSVRMGTGDNSGYGLWPQVTGVSSTVQLANYGDGTPDGVAAYIDITGNAYADWEDVSESDVVYTETGCILTSSTAKIKRGNVIKTKHDTPFVGIVNSVDGSVITLKDGWVAVGATETSTPTAGFGCYINPQNKVWAINSNLTLSENGRSTIGVIQELGILNRKGYNSEIGGIDLVHLAQSTFDSGYGLRIRPANGSNTRSISGVLVQGSQYSFYSSGGGGFSPTYGLFVAGQHEAGAMFSGIGGSKKAIQIQNGAGVARTAINGDGYVEKLHKNVLVASAATLTVPDSYPDVISVVETAQVITLANSGVVPRMVTIEKFGSAGTLAVQPASGNILYKGSYVANVSITGAGKIELRLINITSDGLYQWAANIYKGD